MRRLFNMMIAFALALGVNALAINVAPVAAHDSFCGAGTFCVWQHWNYTGVDHEHFGSGSGDWNFWGIENDDDSLKNAVNLTYVRVYDNANYGNGIYCVVPSEVEDDIHADRDDRGDSHTFAVTSNCSGWPSP